MTNEELIEATRAAMSAVHGYEAAEGDWVAETGARLAAKGRRDALIKQCMEQGIPASEIPHVPFF